MDLELKKINVFYSMLMAGHMVTGVCCSTGFNTSATFTVGLSTLDILITGTGAQTIVIGNLGAIAQLDLSSIAQVGLYTHPRQDLHSRDALRKILMRQPDEPDDQSDALARIRGKVYTKTKLLQDELQKQIEVNAILYNKNAQIKLAMQQIMFCSPLSKKYLLEILAVTHPAVQALNGGNEEQDNITNAKIAALQSELRYTLEVNSNLIYENNQLRAKLNKIKVNSQWE